MRHRKVRAQLPSPTRQVKRTHDARECLKALLDKDAATPYQTGAVQSFRDTGANRERFASEPGSAGPELRAKSLGVLGLIIPPRVRADPFAARRSQALRASPQWVRAKARWYQAFTRQRRKLRWAVLAEGEEPGSNLLHHEDSSKARERAGV